MDAERNRNRRSGDTHLIQTWKRIKCVSPEFQVRNQRAVRGHLLLALRAFVRLEVHRLRTGLSWYEAKAAIIRHAIRAYLAHPLYVLGATA